MGWGEAQRKRKEEQAKIYEQRAQERKVAEAAAAKRIEEERAAAVAKREANARRAAEYVDRLDFRRPGGVSLEPTNILTREGIANAQRTSSPAIRAEEALQTAMKDSSNIPPEEMAESLERLVAEALTAGVSVNSPVIKRAQQLQGVLAASSKGAGAPDDPMADTMKAIFGDYVLPDDLDVDS